MELGYKITEEFSQAKLYCERTPNTMVCVNQIISGFQRKSILMVFGKRLESMNILTSLFDENNKNLISGLFTALNLWISEIINRILFQSSNYYIK